jgi:phosphatidylserine decarboxylase
MHCYENLLLSIDDKVFFRQTAGRIARRIVCDVIIGDQITTGQQCGTILFGKRIDIWVPENFTICISVGQTVIGGETIIAKLS